MFLFTLFNILLPIQYFVIIYNTINDEYLIGDFNNR